MDFAVKIWITAHDGRRVKIGIPVGMKLSDVEDQLHERYWSPQDSDTTAEKEGHGDG